MLDICLGQGSNVSSSLALKLFQPSGQFGMVYKAHLVRNGGQTELGVANQQAKLKFVAVKVLKGNMIPKVFKCILV